MTFIRYSFLLLTLSGSLTSCRLLAPSNLAKALPFSKKEKSTDHLPTERGWGLMYPEAAAQAQRASAGGVDTMGGTQTSAQGGMFDFSGVVQTATQGSSAIPWTKSAADAMKQARLENKLVLILVTHQMSLPSQAIENTFMLTPEFLQITADRCVPLRLDYSDKDTKESDYYRAFKKRIKASGYPLLLVTLPDGTELLRLAGYKPEWQERYLKSLQAAIATSDKAIADRRKSMEKNGYRIWKTKNGTDVFARLSALDANMATFTSEWGESFDTFVSRLSEEDQAWIAERQAQASVSP